MKLKILLYGISCLALSSCASSPPKQAQTGPAILNVRSNPDVVNLDRNFQATSPAEVLAEVKDFSSPVQSVQLKFKNAPIQVPMQHLSGTTWRATLSPEHLKRLGIGDQTTKYDISLTAQSADGKSVTVADAGSVKVKGPDLQRDF